MSNGSGGHGQVNDGESSLANDFLSRLPVATYGHLLRTSDKFFVGIGHKYDVGSIETVARAILQLTASSRLGRSMAYTLPNSISAILEHDLERIIAFVHSKPAGYYAPGEDNFHKDLGIATGTLIPVGARVVELHSMLWRRLLMGGGVRQMLQFSHLWVTSGRRSYLQGHTHSEMLDQFNEAGFEAAYRRIAQLMVQERSISGYFASSWFYDPAVAAISPHLSFLLEFPLKHGAFLLFDRIDTSGNAFVRSNRRKKLYAEGKFLPKKYVLVWPRAVMTQLAF